MKLYKKISLAFLLDVAILVGMTEVIHAESRNEYLLNHKPAEVLLATPESEIGSYAKGVDVITIGQKEVKLQGYNPSRLN